MVLRQYYFGGTDVLRIVVVFVDVGCYSFVLSKFHLSSCRVSPRSPMQILLLRLLDRNFKNFLHQHATGNVTSQDTSSFI